MTSLHFPSHDELRINDVLEYLQHHLPGYPFDDTRDTDFVRELLDDFDHVDVLEQIKRFRWYHDNAPPTGKARLNLRKWIAGAQASRR